MQNYPPVKMSNSSRKQPRVYDKSYHASLQRADDKKHVKIARKTARNVKRTIQAICL